jgi:hypothetical protein
MKHTVKLFAIIISLLMFFTSCSFIQDAIEETIEETQRVAEFTEDFADLVAEPSIEKAESLVHPNSSITPETVLERITENEKLASLDMSQEITVSEIGDLSIAFKDETLGGNVYTLDCVIMVGDVPINVTLKLLSAGDTLGIYDFDIK